MEKSIAKNRPKNREEARRDEALIATFPASDAIPAASGPTTVEPDRPATRRPAAIDKALVDELAKEVERKRGAA